MTARRVVSPRRVVVGYHDPAHAALSGYDHLAFHVRADWLDIGTQIASRLRGLGRLWGIVRTEASLARRLRGADLAHFLYGEHHLVVSPALHRARVVVTLHKSHDWYFGDSPSSDWRFRMLNRRLRVLLRRSSGIILLDDTEIEAFRASLPGVLVEMIPHGVNDLSHFRCLAPEAHSAEIAIVGSHLRDFATIERVIELALRERPDWRFVVMGSFRTATMMRERLPNVVACERLANDAFLSRFARCHAHLLATQFASANNAMLEAHSLGVPTIANDCRALRNYGLVTTQFFATPQQAFEQLRGVIESAHLQAMRIDTARDASRFGWPEIGRRVEEFYDRVMSATSALDRRVINKLT